MAEHLTALDATFLELEEADESAHMHIGAAMVFQAPPGGRPPTIEELRAHLGERLGMLPRYRQRLSSPRTGGLSWPAWDPDPAFDLAAHVRRARLPRPGGEAELLEWLDDFWSHRLDRARPLWEIVLLEGMPRGRWALVTKTHHCMVDGVGSVDVGDLLFDASPDGGAPEPVDPPPAAPEAHPHLGPVLGAVADAARAGADATLHPHRTAERAAAMIELLVRDELHAAPRTSLNVPIGGHRREAVVRTRLDELKAIRGALGGTVNDVVLAVVTGGLRRLLEERGEQLPEQGLRAMVPMNLRSAGEHLALGNKITSLFAALPVAEPDPMNRYTLVRRETGALKDGHQALGGRTLVDLAATVPPVIHTFLARSLFATRLFNVTVTNVPGPQATRYAFGSAMREVIPLVPLAAEHAVGIAIVSYDGQVTFGLNVDRESVPDVAVLAEGIEESLAQLRELAREAAPA